MLIMGRIEYGENMYKVIIVDDERPTLNMLANYIDWNQMSACVVATANNGQNALKKIEALQPDILITDVKMPVMDGIELCKQVHIRFPEIQIVFLSGYNEFEYARAALQHGACGYLLKPVNKEEIVALMKTVSHRLEEQKKHRKSSLSACREYFRDFLQAKGCPNSDLIDEITSIFNNYLHLPNSNDLFYFVLITIDEYSLLTETLAGREIPSSGRSIVEKLEMFINALPTSIFGILIKYENGKWIFITEKLNYEDFSYWKSQCIEAQSNISIFLPDEPQTILSFLDKWPYLCKLCKQFVAVRGTGHLEFHWENICFEPRKTSLPSTEQLIIAVQKKDRVAVSDWLNDFYGNGLPDGRIHQAFINTVSVFENLLSTLASNNRRLYEIVEKDADFLGYLSLMESMQSMKTHMWQMLNMIMDELESASVDHHLEIARQVCEMIKEDCGQVLSVDILAKRVFLSPHYFSTIFKEATGKTLLEYITDVRMEKACSLLKDTNMKIHEIAKQVGYESPAYFGSAFLKRYSLTPNQYRLHYKGGTLL